jgi:hypothetical protein
MTISRRRPSLTDSILTRLLAEAEVKKTAKNIGNISKHKEAIKKKLQGGEPEADVKKTPKNIGNISKHKDAIKQKLSGADPTDAVAAVDASTGEEAKKVPKNMGKMAQHRAAIHAYLKQKQQEVGMDKDPDPTKPYDDVEAMEPEPVKTSDQAITGEVSDTDELVDDAEEKEEEVEAAQEAKARSRIMSIDRTKINKELKVMCVQSSTSIPINTIKEILKKYKLKLVDDDGHDADIKLIGVDGNTDIELAYENGKVIDNSAMVLYWHQIERTDQFEFHCYLS